MLKPKVIFVDLDGTLADSMPLLYDLYLEVMKSLGEEGTRKEFNHLVGPSLSEIAEVIVKRHSLKLSPESLAKQYHAQLRRLYFRVPLSSGAQEFLDYAKEKHLPLAIVTSAEADLAEEFLETQKIRSYFEKIFTSEGLEHSKPYPAIYERALAQMGVTAEEALAIEDSQTGITAAEKAGILTLPFGPYTWSSIVDFIDKNS